jgi:hypothetical protein
MNNLIKNEILEKLLKLVQTDRDMNILLSPNENDLKILPVVLRDTFSLSSKYDAIRCLKA